MLQSLFRITPLQIIRIEGPEDAVTEYQEIERKALVKVLDIEELYQFGFKYIDFEEDTRWRR